MILKSKVSFLKALNSLRLKKNKHYLLHVSLIDIGLIKDVEPEKLCEFIYSSLLKIIPTGSTIYTLSPDYNYAKKKIPFNLNDKNISKEIGSFSKYIFSLKNSYRSNNPLFNLCSIGPNAKKINSNCSPTAFGVNSVWDKLYKKNCEMIFIGCDLSVCTFLRYIEFNFGVPYLYNKYFNLPIKKHNRVLNTFSISPLRFLNTKIEYNTNKFQRILKEKRLLTLSKSKDFKIMKLNTASAFKVGIEELSKNTFFFLKKKPAFNKKFSPYL